MVGAGQVWSQYQCEPCEGVRVWSECIGYRVDVKWILAGVYARACARVCVCMCVF